MERAIFAEKNNVLSYVLKDGVYQEGQTQW